MTLPTRLTRPSSVIAIAAALFAIVLVLKLSVTTPGFGFPLLYDIPVALIAIGFGLRGGLAAAAFAMVLYAIGDSAGEIHSNVWGYTSRAATFVLLAGLLGLYSDRLRRMRAVAGETEARLKRSQQMAGLGSWEWDIAADAVTWSDELHRLYGIEPSEFEPSYAGFVERVHPDDREAVEAAVGEAYESGEPFEFDHRIVRPNGAVRVLHARGEVTLDEQGKPVAMAGTGQDVTVQRRAEGQFRTVTETAPDAIVTADSAGRITYINGAASQLFGYSSDELEGEPLSVLMPERSRAAHARGLRRFLATGQARIVGSTVELVGLRRGGAEFPLELSLGSWEVAGETFFTGLIRDITKRKRAEEAQTLAAIVESSDDAIVGEDLEGTIVSWNRGAERLYGYGAADIIGNSASLLVPGDRPDELPGILERIRRGERVDHYETVRQAADGRRLDISLSVSPVRDDDGTITGASVIGRDVTRRKEADRELRRLTAELQRSVQALAAANRELEAFSYSVSHDLRAPLRAVDGFSRAVIEDYGDRLDEEGRAMLEEACAGSQRMGRLIDEMLTLSQLTRKELNHGSVDLSAMAAEIGSALKAEAPDRQVELVIEPRLIADGDSELLEIALRNLLENAWKFTAESPEPRIELRYEPDNGRSAYVVRDNGAGFDMRYAEKLFRPFERLHREDEYPGVGVGLATVQRVVRRHGGTIWAEGRVGEGAAFFFDLPNGGPQ